MKSVKRVVSLAFVIVMLFSLLGINVNATVQYTDDLVPAMTSNTSPNGIASASSEYSADYAAYKAFDNLKNLVYWSSTGTTGWLAYEFSTPKIIKKYTMNWALDTNNAYTSQCPKNWTFEAWNGTQWVVLDTRTNQINWDYNVKREYTFSNSTAYNKYRINVSANNGSLSYLGIGEIEMMEELAVPNAPLNLTGISGNAKVDLSWGNITGSAISFNIKRSTTAGGAYTTIATTSAITFTDNTAVTGTTYYYVVSAVDFSGESANSNEVSATPTAPASISGNKAILEIAMVNGTEKEYDLTVAELQSFLTWYDGRSDGTGKAYYTFIKKVNIKPFISRKEYIAFDKILSFEVKDYND